MKPTFLRLVLDAGKGHCAILSRIGGRMTRGRPRASSGSVKSKSSLKTFRDTPSVDAFPLQSPWDDFHYFGTKPMRTAEDDESEIAASMEPARSRFPRRD